MRPGGIASLHNELQKTKKGNRTQTSERKTRLRLKLAKKQLQPFIYGYEPPAVSQVEYQDLHRALVSIVTRLFKC